MRRKGSQIADFIVSEYRRNQYWKEKAERLNEKKQNNNQEKKRNE